jgi:hypothetical protein
MIEADFERAIGDFSVSAPHHRAWIYRNNVASALASALAVRFPATAHFAGDRAFRTLAMDYALRERPRSPVLIDYGASFAAYLDGAAQSTPMPWLSDLARLENLWWQAYHAPDAAPAEPSLLAGIAPDELASTRFAVHPSAGLITSRHAVASLWQAYRAGEAVPESAGAGAQTVLVTRPSATVELRVLSRASHSFIAAIMAGDTLETAVDHAAGHADFDLATQISGLFSLGLITGHRT